MFNRPSSVMTVEIVGSVELLKQLSSFFQSRLSYTAKLTLCETEMLLWVDNLEIMHNNAYI